jgi:hypothetical protein
MRCFEAGPRPLTHRLRKRAAGNRVLAKRIHFYLQCPLGEAVCRESFQFADFLDALADETSKLRTWPLMA